MITEGNDAISSLSSPSPSSFKSKPRRRSLALPLPQPVPLPSPSISSDHVLYNNNNHNIVQSLDLSLSLSSSYSHLGNILQGSISEAMIKLQCLQAELHCNGGSSDYDPLTDTETDDDALMTSSDEADVVNEVEGNADGNTTSTASKAGDSNSTHNQNNETLKAFLQEVYDLLSSIRRDVQDQMPSISSAASIPSNALHSLASNFKKTQDLLQHLSIYSPLSVNLPEFPSSFYVLSTAAKEVFVTAGGNLNNETMAASSSVHAPSSSPSSSSPSSPFKLPRPPISAIRSYLASESARLQSKLPSRPAFQDWPANVQSVLHDASSFVQDESEKLKDFMQDEADKFKNALKAGATRLLDFHELPAEWRNNKVSGLGQGK